MKKIAQVLAIVLTVVSSAAFATGTDKGKTKSADQNVSVSIQPYENGKGMNLTAANADNEKVSVTIYDAFGETVFAETVTTSPEIHRNYNFSSLPAGSYSVSVVAENYTVSKTVEIR